MNKKCSQLKEIDPLIDKNRMKDSAQEKESENIKIILLKIRL